MRVLLLLAFAIASTGKVFCSKPPLPDTATVVYIDGKRVSKQEFVFVMNGYRSACYAYFAQKYNCNVDGFWHHSFNGEIPLEWMKKETLKNIVKTRKTIEVVQQYNLLRGFCFDSFLQYYTSENNRRENAVANGQVIYGPVNMDMASMYTYVISNALNAAKSQRLLRCPFSEAYLKKQYDLLKKDKYQQARDVRIELFEIAQGLDADSVRNRFVTLVNGKTGHQFEMARKPLTERISVQEVNFIGSFSRTDELKWGEVHRQSFALAKAGATSPVFENGGGIKCFVFCKKIQYNGYMYFKEIKNNLKADLAEEILNRSIKAAAAKAAINIQTGVWQHIEIEG